MKNKFKIITTSAVLTLVLLAMSFTAEVSPVGKVAASDGLYATLYALDQRFFQAYNTCDMDTQSELLAEDIEFYHDQGGLSTSKAQILKGTKENICGKVTRTLVPGSLEVSPIAGYGAAIVGLHKFENSTEPEGSKSKECRFAAIWKETNGHWQMTRILSLH